MTTDTLVEGIDPDEPVLADAPRRLAPERGAFGRLFGASVASNLADGIGRTAVPLLAVTLTDDPVAISIISALAFLPWLLFGIPSGVIVDRIDRRLAMAAANGIRVLVAIGLTLAIASDNLSLPMLFAAVVAFGLGETLADNATNALIPSVVGSGSLDRANGRIMGAQIGIDHFIAMPIAGMLYGIAIVVPVVTAAGGYVVAGLLALALPAVVGRGAPVGRGAVAEHNATAEASDQSRVKITAREGIRYLLAHRYLRAMTIATALMGGFFQLAQATTLLIFLDEFGVKPEAFGFVAAGIGAGAVAGALTAPRAVARWGRGKVMLGGSILGCAGIGAVGLASALWVAMVAYGVGAFGASMWNVPWGSLRQEIIPDRLLGRVIGVMRTVTWGLYPIATVAGGWIGRVDLRVPFIVGGIGGLIVIAWASRLFRAADSQAKDE